MSSEVRRWWTPDPPNGAPCKMVQVVPAADFDKVVAERDEMRVGRDANGADWLQERERATRAEQRVAALEATVARVRALRDRVGVGFWSSAALAGELDRALAPEVEAQTPLCGVCNTVSTVIMNEHHGFGRCGERRTHTRRVGEIGQPRPQGYPSWDRRKRGRRGA